jgi:preprotein translocase subunit SecY
MDLGLSSITKIPELKKRVIFTLVMLVIFRIGVFVPTPGIDANKLKSLFETSSGTLFGMINMLAGGALENFSVFALGIMPYISVSIIMQLLATSVKQLEELQNEGEQGKRVITRYTRYGTIALALLQGYFASVGLESKGVVANPGMEFRLITALTLATGTAFLMWIGEQISERGIGNGISILIFSGIVARMPATIGGTFDLMTTREIHPLTVLMLFAFGIATVAAIVFVERAQRRIPVHYPRRTVGKMMTQASTQHLPLKLNTAGVIPAIFAYSLLSLPLYFAEFGNIQWLKDAVKFMTPPSIYYEVVFIGLVIFFCYFYTAIVFDPQKIADNLKKNHGFIPSVRPGKETADFVSTVLTRITLWGAIYVCLICIVPSLFYTGVGAGAFASFFGGTAVLIVVGVTMDTASQIQSYVLTRNYEEFLKKGTGKVYGASRGIQMKGQLIKR